jgi:PAS domain S-box-containing protein
LRDHGCSSKQLSDPINREKDQTIMPSMPDGDHCEEPCRKLEALSRELQNAHQREQALKSSDRQWQDIFDTIADGLCVLDGELGIVRLNRAMCQILEVSEEQALGRKCGDLVHDAAHAPADCPFNHVRQSRIRSKTTMPFKHRWFELTIDPRFDTRGDLQGYICFMSDVTQAMFNETRMEQERSRSEARIRQAQKMEAIGALAGGIAHDFNNILSAILGYAELALDEAGSGRTTPAYVQQILRAGNRARDLVHQILTFSRQSESEARPIQILPIVKEAVKLLRASLPSTIDIQVNARSDALVMADPIQIHQVMMNLCTNAGYAMRHGGLMKVSLLEEVLGPEMVDRHAGMRVQGCLKLQVSDTGPGIEPAMIDRIFEPYYSTKPKEEGSGMGLAVVQGIVRACGGTITVESIPGKGATFNVYLPIIHHTGAPGQLSSEMVPLGCERILFVDDEAPLAELAQEMLSRLGYQVTIRTSSIQALSLFERRPHDFDLVITDYTMPGITGDLLAEKLKAIRPDIPIVICTGYSRTVSRNVLDRLGISDLIMKPITRSVLAATIRKILDSNPSA